MFHVNHAASRFPASIAVDVSRESLANAKLRKDDVQQILDVNAADNPPQPVRRNPQVLRAKFRLSTIYRLLQKDPRLPDQLDMTQTGRQNVRRRVESLFRPAGDLVHEVRQPRSEEHTS